MKSDPCSVWASLAITLVCLVVSADATSNAPTPPVVPKSGLDYASAEVRALQADDASNPGMLWVAQGEMLWSEVVGAEAKSCAQCHGLAPTSMKAVPNRSRNHPGLRKNRRRTLQSGRKRRVHPPSQHPESCPPPGVP